MPFPKRRRTVITTLVLLVVIVSPLAVMAVLVDDWSRDLSQNTSSTAPEHADPRLRPREVDASVDALNSAVARFVASHAAWRRADEKPLPGDSPIATYADPPARVVHFVRSTRLLRFRDDVWLVVEPIAERRVRLHVDSRSRLGKGDLGQNPRNVRELLGALAGER